MFQTTAHCYSLVIFNGKKSRYPFLLLYTVDLVHLHFIDKTLQKLISQLNISIPAYDASIYLCVNELELKYLRELTLFPVYRNINPSINMHVE